MTQIPLSPHDAKQYSPLSLAFLGDSVFDTLIREQLLRTANQPPAALHQKKVALVCAGFQATVMRELLPTLTEEEQAVFLRGRNAAPKHAHQAEYRYATGLEALRPVLSDEALDFTNRDAVFDACKAKAEELGKKNGWLLYPLGIALSGKQRTPGGGTDLACMMGREKTLERVKAAIEKLNG